MLLHDWLVYPSATGQFRHVHGLLAILYVAGGARCGGPAARGARAVPRPGPRARWLAALTLPRISCPPPSSIALTDRQVIYVGVLFTTPWSRY